MVNILYLHTHDSGRFLQPYGYAIPTPHLMSLAQDGVLFRNCFCAAPSCSPSRSAMLTGMSPHSSGMIGLAHRGFSLNNPTQHLAHHLANHGYDTVLCGVQHEISGGREKELGYQHILRGDTLPDKVIQNYQLQNQAPRFLQDFANAQVKIDLSTQLTHWMETTNDPLILGPVPKPKGAFANRKDSLNPFETVWEE